MPCLRSKWAFPFENGRASPVCRSQIGCYRRNIEKRESCHAFTLKSLNINESSLKNFAHARMCEVFKARLDNVSKSVNQTTFFL